MLLTLSTSLPNSEGINLYKLHHRSHKPQKHVTLIELAFWNSFENRSYAHACDFTKKTIKSVHLLKEYHTFLLEKNTDHIFSALVDVVF
jgi:hypothetical protein